MCIILASQLDLYISITPRFSLIFELVAEVWSLDLYKNSLLLFKNEILYSQENMTTLECLESLTITFTSIRKIRNLQ